MVRLLDELGVHFIEGGWPGANPKDDEFFARATKELELERAQLVAFGSTRRPRGAVERDPSSRRCSMQTPISSASSASHGIAT